MVDHFVTVGNLTYFGADDGVHGWRLWAYDGCGRDRRYTVADFVPGWDGSWPTGWTCWNRLRRHALLLRGQPRPGRPSSGRRRERPGPRHSSPTSTPAGFSGSYPGKFVVFRSQVHFVADDDGVDESEIWRTDGTEVGTVQVSSISTGRVRMCSDLTVVQVGHTVADRLLDFSGDDGVIGNDSLVDVPAEVRVSFVESWDLVAGADGSFLTSS